MDVVEHHTPRLEDRCAFHVNDARSKPIGGDRDEAELADHGTDTLLLAPVAVFGPFEGDSHLQQMWPCYAKEGRQPLQALLVGARDAHLGRRAASMKLEAPS